MALQEEYEYAAFRCAFCNFFNPAKKLRPMAPRLPSEMTPAVNILRPSTSSESSSGGFCKLSLVRSTKSNFIYFQIPTMRFRESRNRQWSRKRRRHRNKAMLNQKSRCLRSLSDQTSKRSSNNFIELVTWSLSE
jgi:hypothetical protein